MQHANQEHRRRSLSARTEYISTYRKDFTGEFGHSAGTARPRSSSIYPNGDKIEIPTYRNDFRSKPVQASELRPRLLSRESRNNPHPLKPFLVWRLNGLDALKQWRKIPVDRHGIDVALRNQLKSTYQVDYAGLQNGR